MEKRNEIHDFLVTRRARITPEETDLPAFGSHRRVPGLRREEVAMLAGVSVDYYIRLERGDALGASEEVLDGVARALRLNGDERAHLKNLFDDAKAAGDLRDEQVRPAVRRIVDAMSVIPAMVRNRRLDILYANRLGQALYSGVFDNPVRPPNPARYVFFDEASRGFFDNWSRVANDMAALLHAESARNPGDERLSALITELSASDEFRSRWSAQHVLFHRTGVAHYHHPVVGDLTLAYEDLIIPEGAGQTILVFTPAADTATDTAADTFDRLSAWSSTLAPVAEWAVGGDTVR